jgi:hypothetical protein
MPLSDEPVSWGFGPLALVMVLISHCQGQITGMYHQAQHFCLLEYLSCLQSNVRGTIEVQKSEADPGQKHNPI